MWRLRNILLAIVFMVGPAGGASAATPAERLAVLTKKYEETRTRFVADLEALAVQCEMSEVPQLASEIRQLVTPQSPLTENLDSLPTRIQSEVPANTPPAEKAVRVRVQKLRQDYAAALYLLTKKAIDDQHSSFAYRLVQEIMRHAPDHPQTRSLLGYRRVGDEWTTPFALEMKRDKKVWHDEFGWIPAQNVARYSAGERYYNGQWITAAREETIRSDFNRAWEVETEHFYIRTNHSQQKGARLAASVEVFHRYFMREFAAFFKKPQQRDKLFSAHSASRNGDLYEIYYFRQQQEFIDRLQNQCPNVQQINGIYLPGDRRAYFFHSQRIPENESIETLYHEVTHQLLSESSKQQIPVGHARDFWVVEGIACYFESFRIAEDGTISVGDPHHPRIQVARDQVVVTQDQEPLARFTLQGMLNFQAGTLPVLQKRYAQATGLAHFFMNYQGGIYRDGFIEYLAQIYSPDQRVRDKSQTLEQILGVTYATLDQQYADYFRKMPSGM